ncbi:MAG: TIGR03905 family TSCPD domain-containing protein [Erysipelotrichaceae bacterium]|nr:TIGR03905 family TSCPD domain-containing protein [Erysipelotrichaceae bacterium]
MHYDCPMRGTCARQVSFDVVDGKVVNIHFLNGCHGNTQGVAALADGMEKDEIIRRLRGIKCGMRPTSCPDQFAQRLEEIG